MKKFTNAKNSCGKMSAFLLACQVNFEFQKKKKKYYFKYFTQNEKYQNI